MRTNLSSQFTPEVIRATGAKIIARNTFLRAENGETITRLHGTDIVRVKPGRTLADREAGKVKITLNSGGYKTMVTKDRINTAIRPYGYTVFSGKGMWRVARGSGWYSAGPSVPFYDGIVLPRALDEPGAAAKAERAGKAERDMKREIKRFADILDEGVPMPDGGDCWLCIFERAKITPDKSRESFHGRAPMLPTPGDDVGHLREHIREGYMHGNLILNALLFAGYTEQGAGYFFAGANRGDRREVNHIKQCLRRYLGKRLGLTVKG